MAASSIINGVHIYNLASGKTFPGWVSVAKKRALKKDPSFQRRIELIQDFDFPEASHSISVSRDGRYIVATGTYPPRVRVYDTADLSMKFERYMDSTTVAHCILDEDFTKLAFLQDDRNIEVHAAYGRHYRTRVPVFGRDMKYHQPTAELLVASSCNEIYRLSLEEGRFMSPLVVDAPAVNKLAISRTTALIAAACEGGTVEMWDPRDNSRAGVLNLPLPYGATPDTTLDATCVSFEDTGLGFLVGTSDGRCMLYDLRHSKPVATKIHPYGLPVVSASFHRGKDRIVVSADAKQIKLWHRDESAKTFTNIEATGNVTDACIAPSDTSIGGYDSGLIFAAGEQDKIQIYYLPQLGLAPRWAAFLDGITEELEETKEKEGVSIYDDYKFVTREELAALGLLHLIGTPLLKAYMHGFFMDARLYAKVQALLDPDAHERWRKQKVQQALEKQRASRIVVEDDLPKVNRALAEKLRRESEMPQEMDVSDEEEEEDIRGQKKKEKAKKKASVGASLLGDSRFAALFNDPAFAIDPEEAVLVANRTGRTIDGIQPKKGGAHR